jgi:hypothetical protein
MKGAVSCILWAIPQSGMLRAVAALHVTRSSASMSLQAARLATLAPRERQADAMRLIVQMAGTRARLGFMQGCSMSAISQRP